MIGTATTGCNGKNGNCTTDVSGDTTCVDLSGLVTRDYIGRVPISPNGEGSWDATRTGYTLTITTSSAIYVRACENEHSDQIELVR